MHLLLLFTIIVIIYIYNINNVFITTIYYRLTLVATRVAIYVAI